MPAKIRRMGQQDLATTVDRHQNEYSDVKGFSVRNLQCMIQFYLEYEKISLQLNQKKQLRNQ